MSPPTIDIVDQLPPSSVDPLPSPTVDPMPPPEGKASTDVEPKDFGGGPVDLSLLPLYPDYIANHIWDGEVALVRFFIYFYVNFNS